MPGAIRVVDIGIDLGVDGDDPLPIGSSRRTTSRHTLPPRPPTAHKWMAGVMVDRRVGEA